MEKEDLALEGLKEMDFDLPDVSDGKVTKPRVHIGGDTCVSCEG